MAAGIVRILTSAHFVYVLFYSAKYQNHNKKTYHSLVWGLRIQDFPRIRIILNKNQPEFWKMIFSKDTIPSQILVDLVGVPPRSARSRLLSLLLLLLPPPPVLLLLRRQEAFHCKKIEEVMYIKKVLSNFHKMISIQKTVQTSWTHSIMSCWVRKSIYKYNKY